MAKHSLVVKQGEKIPNRKDSEAKPERHCLLYRLSSYALCPLLQPPPLPSHTLHSPGSQTAAFTPGLGCAPEDGAFRGAPHCWVQCSLCPGWGLYSTDSFGGHELHCEIASAPVLPPASVESPIRVTFRKPGKRICLWIPGVASTEPPDPSC